MNLKPLAIRCPGCGSGEVVYSCDPHCCFNHVCGDCLASFELVSYDLGGRASRIAYDQQGRDSLAPTVACARCESLNVAMVEANDSGLVCMDCMALLELRFDLGQ